jgi:hypothetical protein
MCPASNKHGGTPRVTRITVRFSICLWLLLVGLSALAIGTRVSGARQQLQAVTAIRDYGGHVYFDDELVVGPADLLIPDPSIRAHMPGWLGNLTGKDLFRTAAMVDLSGVPEPSHEYDELREIKTVALLQRLPDLRSLTLESRQASDDALAYITTCCAMEEIFIISGDDRLTDSGIAVIANLKNLKLVEIEGGLMTDQGLRLICELPHLESLALYQHTLTDQSMRIIGKASGLRRIHLAFGRYGENHISDEGLSFLLSLLSLELLDIQHTAVTDQGLYSLRTLPNLKEVWVYGCPVTEAGIQRLRDTRPGLVVH